MCDIKNKSQLSDIVLQMNENFTSCKILQAQFIKCLTTEKMHHLQVQQKMQSFLFALAIISY